MTCPLCAPAEGAPGLPGAREVHLPGVLRHEATGRDPRVPPTAPTWPGPRSTRPPSSASSGSGTSTSPCRWSRSSRTRCTACCWRVQEHDPGLRPTALPPLVDADVAEAAARWPRPWRRPPWASSSNTRRSRCRRSACSASSGPPGGSGPARRLGAGAGRRAPAAARSRTPARGVQATRWRPDGLPAVPAAPACPRSSLSARAAARPPHAAGLPTGPAEDRPRLILP